ncbi:MAG: DUF192 domain-containing protein [Rhodospirillales bacterium]|nr:DUF192 domain-containing protein [Rhodospirillales bacterium]
MSGSMRRLIAAGVLLGAVWMAALAGRAGEPVSFATGELSIVTGRGSYVFSVELASTPAEREQGLQGRRALAPSTGMLFDFKSPRPVYMWMKNTYISLDMLFIDGEGRVANIAERTVPMSLATVGSDGPVRAVLEVDGGTARRLGIKPGDRVVHRIFGNGG